MEHACYRCQADIPESTAFCPHCGAPQIRVVSPEGEVQDVPLSSGEVPAHVQPPLVAPPPSQYWAQSNVRFPASPGAVHWELAWKGALLCGVGAAVLSAIPIVSIGFLIWMIGAGVFSVSLYRRQMPGATVTPGMGMRIGALAGVFGFVLDGVFFVASFVTLRNTGSFRQLMEEQMQKQLAGNPDPKVQQMMENLLNWMNTPRGAATVIAFFLLIVGIVFVVLTAAGGALSASFSGRHREFQ